MSPRKTTSIQRPDATSFYLDVPRTGHKSIIDVGSDEDREQWSAEVHNRRHIFQQALRAPLDELRKEEVRPWELQPLSDAERERHQRVNHVIFVIHGIRDVGHWTDKVARRVWKLYKERQAPNDSENHPPQTLEKVIDSYGYFGMGPFLLPHLRWKKVVWFMERYLVTRAAYPMATFSYIGHSPKYPVVRNYLRARLSGSH